MTYTNVVPLKLLVPTKYYSCILIGDLHSTTYAVDLHQRSPPPKLYTLFNLVSFLSYGPSQT